MKSTKAPVHKQRRTQLYFQYFEEAGTRRKASKIRSARTPKTRKVLDLEKPRQWLQQLAVQVTHPQHILGVPHVLRHRLELQFQLLLVESLGLPTQTATFLIADLPSAWAPSPLVKANPFLLLCPAAPVTPLCLGQAQN